MKLRLTILAAVLTVIAALTIPAVAATASIPAARRCVHVVIVTRTITGTETDLPVVMCGIARRWGPWTCATSGQFGADMKLACTRP